MTSLIPNVNIISVQPKAPLKTEQVAVQPFTAKPEKPLELSNFPTTNMLAQLVRKNEHINAVNLSKPLQRYEWKNDLRTLIQDNKAVIWAMIPRTFNAKDKNVPFSSPA